MSKSRKKQGSSLGSNSTSLFGKPDPFLHQPFKEFKRQCSADTTKRQYDNPAKLKAVKEAFGKTPFDPSKVWRVRGTDTLIIDEKERPGPGLGR